MYRKMIYLMFVVLALGLTTTVASAVERVNYNYATTGIGTGSGMWSVTIDSGLIPNPDYPDVDPNNPYLEPNEPVTFMAPMAEPVFVQRDELLAGDVIPDIPGICGWANNAFNDGKEGGMEWKFYDFNDTVTLYAVTEDYSQYTWEIQTILAGHKDDSLIELQNNYYWRVSLCDNPDGGGLDSVILEGQRHRSVSWWGDVDTFDGHKHSGNKWDWDDDPTFLPGQDYLNESDEGGLDEGAQGDGIGVSLGFREFDKQEKMADASIFFYNVFFGGDVFADPEIITIY